jgi:hypothetical protein
LVQSGFEHFSSRVAPVSDVLLDEKPLQCFQNQVNRIAAFERQVAKILEHFFRLSAAVDFSHCLMQLRVKSGVFSLLCLQVLKNFIMFWRIFPSQEDLAFDIDKEIKTERANFGSWSSWGILFLLWQLQ